MPPTSARARRRPSSPPSSTTPAPTAASSATADGSEVEKIVEAKAAGDATEAELAIKEINAGIYVFDGPALAAALPQLSNDNAQGEYYLPDMLPLLREAGGRIVAHVSPDPNVILGVNSRVDLALIETEARRQILERHMLAGVTVVDPSSTWIEVDVEIAPDVRIEPGCSLIGDTSDRHRLGRRTAHDDDRLADRRRGGGAPLLPARVRRRRPLQRSARSPISARRPSSPRAPRPAPSSRSRTRRSAPGSKVPHLSYIGDADVGEGANLGAATITANYDGFVKNRTKIGHGARTSVDTTLVAPVEIGDSAYTGAGSVIDEDVPPGALGIARARQTNIEGFAERKPRKTSRK